MASRREQKEEAKRIRIEKEKQLAARDLRRRRILLFGSVIAIAIITVTTAVFVSLGSKTPVDSEQAAETVQARFKDIPQDGAILGDPSAPVTVYEFADLKCPVCKVFTTEAFPRVIDDYVRSGKAKFSFQNLTFLDNRTQGTPDSTIAAKFAAGAAEQDKLWNFVDLWYIHQQNETEVYATPEYLASIADQVPGLSAKEAFEFSGTEEASAYLKRADELQNLNNVMGTPAFLVARSDRPEDSKMILLDDPRDPSALTRAIDELAAK